MRVGRGDTGKASSVDSDKVGAGGRHGARLAQRARFAGRRENPADESLGMRGDDRGREASVVAHESSGVGVQEGGGEASGVAENPWGYRQGVGGGVELPQGTNTPGVAELPLWDKTPGVTTTGKGIPREDGRGQGGDENPPTTRATGAQGNSDGEDESMGGLRMAAPLRPQRGTAADNGSAGNPTRYTAGTDSARPEHGALVRRKYGLLAPMGTEVDTADVGDPGSEDGHKATG